MSNPVPAQHPAVVLRSNYQHLRALLAIATIAIIGLTVAVVVLAISTGASTSANPPAHANRSAELTVSTVSSYPPGGPNPDQATP